MHIYGRPITKYTCTGVPNVHGPEYHIKCIGETQCILKYTVLFVNTKLLYKYSACMGPLTFLKTLSSSPLSALFTVA